jgi:hypothetical protein
VFGVSVGHPTSDSVFTALGTAAVTADEQSASRFGSGVLL